MGNFDRHTLEIVYIIKVVGMAIGVDSSTNLI